MNILRIWFSSQYNCTTEKSLGLFGVFFLNSYNRNNYLMNILRIWFSYQYKCTTEKSLFEQSVTIGAKNVGN